MRTSFRIGFFTLVLGLGLAGTTSWAQEGASEDDPCRQGCYEAEEQCFQSCASAADLEACEEQCQAEADACVEACD